MLVQFCKDARRLEKALAETMHTSAEWKRIADALKAERDAAKQEAMSARQDAVTLAQALGIAAAKEAGKLLGMVEGEGLRAAAQRVVKERDALRTECDDLRRVFSLVHGSLGIQQGEHIGNAIDALKKERDELATRLRQSIARGDFAEMRAATLLAELAEQKPSFDPTVAKMESTAEASHITPEGKQTAEGAVEPKPGDVVRLVRVPSEDTVGDTLRKSLEWPWKSLWGSVGDRGEVVESVGTMPGARSVRIMNTGVKVWWPLSCVEIVKGAQAAAEPKPGDVVRLVRVPTVKDCSKYDFQDSEQLRLISTQVNTMGKVVGTELCEACACVVDDTGTIKAWPLSCIEVVKGVDK